MRLSNGSIPAYILTVRPPYALEYMSTLTADDVRTATARSSYSAPQSISDSDVVELPLLLPRWQVDALEEAASVRGMTTGQMIRRVFSEMLRPQR